MRITELWVRNFKSLRDVKLSLRSFNLVVGPNGSGKTNLIDALEFFRDALTAEGFPRPWRKWWSPENVAWMRDETLPLTFGFSFQSSLSTGSAFRIEREVLRISGWGTLERVGDVLRVSYEEGFLSRLGSKVDATREFRIKLDSQRSLLHPSLSLSTGPLKESELGEGVFEVFSSFLMKGSTVEDEGGEPAGILSPEVTIPKAPRRVSQLEYTLAKLRDLIAGVTVLRPLNVQEVRKPQEYARTLRLESDGRNLYVVLYNLFLRENRLPEMVADVLSMALEGYELRFDLTQDGRVFAQLVNGDLRLPPPCMPDGVHKLLAMLTALQLKPSILAIDELEDSLHPEWIELVIDLLKSSGTTVIATTHSPAAVDIVDPQELIIAEMGREGTVFKVFEDPEQVKRELRELGITLSERWLWGAPRLRRAG